MSTYIISSQQIKRRKADELRTVRQILTWPVTRHRKSHHGMRRCTLSATVLLVLFGFLTSQRNIRLVTDRAKARQARKLTAAVILAMIELEQLDPQRNVRLASDRLDRQARKEAATTRTPTRLVEYEFSNEINIEKYGGIENVLEKMKTDYKVNVPFYVYEELIFGNATYNGMPFNEQNLNAMFPGDFFKHTDDLHFGRSALLHPMRVMDPEQAMLFYVPSPLNQIGKAIRRSMKDPIGTKYCYNGMCNMELYKYIDDTLGNSKWFLRHNGKDHIIVTSHYAFHPKGGYEGIHNFPTVIASDRFNNINQCNKVVFEYAKSRYLNINRVNLPALYVGEPCQMIKAENKELDFALIASLKRGGLDRERLCSWILEEEKGSNPDICGGGEKCPTIANAKFGLHVKGDTYGSSRLIDLILSGTVPVFTAEEQYNVIPDWIPWKHLSYFADVSNKTKFTGAIDEIRSDTEGYEKKLRLITKYGDMFDIAASSIPFDMYMYMFQTHIFPNYGTNNT